MALTVSEAIKLDSYSNFKLIAGHRGLNRVIERVGFLDWEVVPQTDDKYPQTKASFVEGEFALCSMLFAKDHPERILDAVKFLERNRLSGLAVKNIYYNELPEEVIRFADEKAFPIFIFHTTYFEDIMTETTDKIRSIDNSNLLESKIDLMIKANLNKAVIRDIALEINSSFQESFLVVYAKGKRDTSNIMILNRAEEIRKDRSFKQWDTVARYQNGLLLIATFEKLEPIQMQKKAESLLRMINADPEEYYIGISNLHTNLNELGVGINESLFAEKSGEVFPGNSFYFKDIGIFSMLIPFSKDPWTQDFYERMVKPIQSYDEKYRTELFETAVKFIEHDGIVAKAAEALFLHKNTIRYRINKIKELLHMEDSELNFYEQLSIAVKLHKIYTR